MSLAELILYATPRGPLADALTALNEEISLTRATTAQSYPPHCTLTGFFHRRESEIERINDELRQALDDLGAMPPNAVEVAALHRRDDWVGLEIRSPWLTRLTERFVLLHSLAAGDDPLRLKDWLHLSIAYGSDDHQHAVAATRDFDEQQSVEWEVALWRRSADGRWQRLDEGIRRLSDDE